MYLLFGNIRNIRKDEQSGSKLKLHKRLLYDKRPVENLALSLLVFSLFQHPYDFCRKINQKTTSFKTNFQSFSKALLPSKFMQSGNALQQNDGHLIFLWNFHQSLLSLLSISKLKKYYVWYLVFLTFVICAIDYQTIVNWGYIKPLFTENRPLKVLFCNFDHSAYYTNKKK